MGNLKDELKNISSDVDSLLSIAQKNSNISEEQLRSINNFGDDVVYALEFSSDITAAKIDDLKYQLASLQNDLAKAIGLAGVMFYKGQELHEDAIKKTGTERATSNLLRGIFTYAGIALGADILGSYLKSGLENSADKIASALRYSNLTKKESSKIGILILILVTLT